MPSMISKRTGTQRGAQSRRHRGRRCFSGLVARNCSQRECADTGSVGEKAMVLPLSIRFCWKVISLVIRQTLCPLLLSKSQAETPCDSLREVVYVDVLSTVRDKMSRWD